MNKKILKTFLTIVIMLLSVMVFQTKVNARHIGFEVDTVTASLRSDHEKGLGNPGDVVEGLPGDDTYCMQQDYKLNAGTIMKVLNYIRIEGNTAIIYSGNKRQELARHENLENGTMAWILAQQDTGSYPYNYSLKQKAIYGFIKPWIRANELFQESDMDTYVADGGYSNQDWVNQGRAYAETVGKEEVAKITNVGEKPAEVESYNSEDGQELLKVGPFTMNWTGDLETVKVLDQNDQHIESTIYARYDGDKLVTSKDAKEIIRSDVPFYVLVPADGSVETINNVELGVVVQKHRINADIWLLYARNGQDLLTIDTDVNTEPDRATSEPIPKIELKGSLRILKVNKDDHSVKLGGVPFVLQQYSTKKYVKKDGETITYVDSKEEATIFKTATQEDVDKGLAKQVGELTIKDLIVGRYILYEQEGNPNYGYELPEEGKEVYVKPDPKEEETEPTENKEEEKTEENKTEENKTEENKTEEEKTENETAENKAEEEKTENETAENKAEEEKTENETAENKTEEEKTEENKTEEEKTEENKTEENKTENETAENKTEENKTENETAENKTEENKTENETAENKTEEEKTEENKTEENKTEENKTEESKTEREPDLVENKQIWVKLSGYVWIDRESGKDPRLNNLYDTDMDENGNEYYDDNDILKEGITVRLIDRTTGEKVKEDVITDKDGKYLFVDVLIEKLKDYYIEFEYDGLVYTNVIPHFIDTTKDEKDSQRYNRYNASKAAENEIKRGEFNDLFTYVEGRDKVANTGVTKFKGEEGIGYNLVYDRGEGDNSNKSFLNYDKSDKFLITATTDEAKETAEDGTSMTYSIERAFKWGMEEVPEINLGLYEREQPDLELIKDVQNAEVSINGKNHIYIYANRAKNDKEEYKPGDFNVGVKFENKRGKAAYTRAIYKSDYKYVNAEDTEKELKVYITYDLKLVNSSTNLVSRVNKIVDYFDDKYELVEIGTGINKETQELTDKLDSSTYNVENAPSVEGYKAIGIKLPDTLRINPGEASDVYLKFELTREKVEQIVVFNDENPEDRLTLDNVAEIASYTTFDKDGRVYAGIDSDSAPDNAILGDKATYEDDTDIAPAFILELADPESRKAKGTVFEDTPIAELLNKEQQYDRERKGDGKYEPTTEHGISGVKVELIEIGENGKEQIAKDWSTYEEGVSEAKDITSESKDGDELGNYELIGFIPGNYKIRFTWGGQTYTYTDENGEEKTITYSARDYKSTTTDKAEWERKLNDPEWYKKEVENRWSDAQDDWERRLEIDGYTADYVYGNSSEQTPDQITADTPEMSLTVELTDFEVTESTVIDEEGNSQDVRLEYVLNNVDFGIVERPIQELTLTKHVSGIKLILPNGNMLVDAKIDSDGNITGERKGLTYLAPSAAVGNGTVKIEVDNELLQGSTVEVSYEFRAVNNSEIDYADSEYYFYGVASEGAQKIKLAAAKIVDYLDGDWGYEAENEVNKNYKWEQKTKEDIENMKLDGTDIVVFSPDVYNEDSNIESSRILLTDHLAGAPLEPGRTSSAFLEVSKVLTSADEISLDNETEIAHVKKDPMGRKPKSIPGNYVPGTIVNTDSKLPDETDTSLSESVTVSPPTGGDAVTYLIYTGIAIVALSIVAGGIVIIKKKTLKE